jgi:tRNA nucleotidyltransferase (CCA-adding enzyme)
MNPKQTAQALWERLSEHSRQLCMTIAQHADERGERAYLVGGSVRDLLLGYSAVDLDIVVEGDAVELAGMLAGDLGGRLHGPSEFLTAAVHLPEGRHIDLTTARQETYPGPAKLPVVRPSTIAEDLGRRDFSVNAMALCLLPGGGASLVDPHGGQHDTAAGLIRVLHPKSFIDDPTRLIRAVRFEQRLGFALERETAECLDEAARGRYLASVTGPRLRDEVAKALQEPAPWRVCGRLEQLGLLADAVPGARLDQPSSRWLREVPIGLIALTRGESRARERVWPYLLGALCARGELDRAIGRLQPDRETQTIIEAMGRAAAAPVPEPVACRVPPPGARLDAVLGGRSLGHPLMYWLRSGASGRRRIEHGACRLNRMQADVTGEQLIEAGVAPGPAIGVGLEAARATKVSGQREPSLQLGAALDAIRCWHRPPRRRRLRPDRTA